MKKVVLLTPALLLAGAAHADVIDISGAGSGGPSIIYFQETSGALEGFSWDLNYSAFSPSWGSEVNIVLTHLASNYTYTFDGSDGNFAESPPATDADTTFGWGNFSGFFASAGSVNASGLDDTSGDWQIEIFDDLIDFPGGIEGVFGSGSTITINKVPAPGALALLGIAALIGRRRR